MARHYLNQGSLLLQQQIAKTERDVQGPNLTYIKGFVRWLQLANRKDRTLWRRLIEARQILIMLGKDGKKATKTDIEDLVLRIDKLGIAATSKNRIKRTLKMLYKYLASKDSTIDDASPPIVRWIKIKSEENKKLPEDLLQQSEIEALIRACMNDRDKAIIAILANFGLRVGELLSLPYSSVKLTDNDVHYVIIRNSKTFERRFPFTRNSLAYPYIVAYLNSRRKPVDRNEALFLTMKGNPIDYPHIRKLLSNLKARTGLQKRLHAHLFRFTAATQLAPLVSESVLCQLMGWQLGSKEVRTYLKLSGKQVDSEIVRITGLKEVRPQKQEPQNKVCRKCGEINPIDKSFCGRCGTSLDRIDIAEELNNYNELRMELLGAKEEISDLRAVLNKVLANQGLKDEKSIRKALQ